MYVTDAGVKCASAVAFSAAVSYWANPVVPENVVFAMNTSNVAVYVPAAAMLRDEPHRRRPAPRADCEKCPGSATL